MKRALNRWIDRARRRARPGLASSDLVSLADAARDERNFGGAAALYAAALRLDPSLAAIQIQCAHMNKETGRHDLAERHYRAAQALMPDDPDLNLQLGHFYKVQGRIGEAVEFYRRAVDLSPDTIDASVELMELTGTGALASRRAAGSSGKANPDFADEPWTRRFNVLEFRTLNPELAAGVRSLDEACALFAAEGIDQLAPIAMDAVFDPAFYRDWKPGTAGLSDVELYRWWLSKGMARGDPGSEAELLRRLHCPAYPRGFDWERYGRQVQRRPGRPHTRWSLLEHLFRTGFVDGFDVPAEGRDAAQLYHYLADDLRARSHNEAALRALARALELAPDDGTAAEKLGDIHMAMGQPDKARDFYRRAHGAGLRSLALSLHLIEGCAQAGTFEEAYALLGEARVRHAGEASWADALRQTVQAHFNAAWAASLDAHRGLDHDRGSEGLAAALGRIVEAYRTLDDLPARLPLCPDGHVVMFSMTDVPQCRHYRVEQRIQQFDHLGITVRAFDGREPDSAREALVGARALIVYREPAVPGTIRLILHAQALGVPVYYELDDLLFDFDHYPGPFEEGQISFEEHVGFAAGIRSYRFAIELSDKAIASTQDLADRMAPLTRDKAALLIPNGLDGRSDPFLREAIEPRRSGEVFIFYGPGARVHVADFYTQVAPALVRVLDQRPQARLVVAGYLDLDEKLSGFSDRVIRLPFIKSIGAYWALLRDMDINLAVLAPGAMNDCKSEIKWLEAAACGVPSIVSASATYKRVLRHEVDALLVASTDDWEAGLLALIDDPDRRLAMATEARRKAIRSYSLDVIARRWTDEFRPGLPGPETARPARKLRVLIAHVLFPPQAFGGATRVVVDNVEDLQRRHGADLDLAVFTADLGAPHPRSRVGRYGDIPVFRFGVSFHASGVYEDASIVSFFNDALDAFKPDVVHFHCVQLLTASIVEVTQSRGIPYLVTLHDGWWLSSNQFMLDHDFFLKRTPARPIEEADDLPPLPEETLRRHHLMGLLRSAALVTAVSNGFAIYHRERTGLAIRAIPNGISPAFVGRRRTGGGRGSGPVRLAHLGGWAPHKGIHLLQAALKRGLYRNLDVTVVDHRRSGGEMDEQVWGTTPVHVIGKVAQTDMAGLYDQFDVLLAPSIWPESFGLITREAMACGLWVVTGRIGGIGDDVVEGGNGLLIDIDGPAGLAGALQAIDDDPARYREPPSVRSTPRVSTDQADDLAVVYREIFEEHTACVPMLKPIVRGPGGISAGAALRGKRAEHRGG